MNPLFSFRLPTVRSFLAPFAFSAAMSACLPSSQPERRVSAPSAASLVTRDAPDSTLRSSMSTSPAYALHLFGRDTCGPALGLVATHPEAVGRYQSNLVRLTHEPASPIFSGGVRKMYESHTFAGRVAGRMFLGSDAGRVGNLSPQDLVHLEARGHQLKAQAGRLRVHAAGTRLGFDVAALTAAVAVPGASLNFKQAFAVTSDMAAMGSRLLAEVFYQRGNTLFKELVLSSEAALESQTYRAFTRHQFLHFLGGGLLITAGACRLGFEWKQYHENRQRFGSEAAWENLSGSNVAFSFFDVGYGTGAIVYWLHLVREASKSESSLDKIKVFSNEVGQSMRMQNTFRFLGGFGAVCSFYINSQSMIEVALDPQIDFQKKTYLQVLNLLGLLGSFFWFSASMLVTVASAPVRQKMNGYAYMAFVLQSLLPLMSTPYGMVIPLAAVPVVRWYQRSKQETEGFHSSP